jgi:tetratricopeptide (TPR) repeat protein
MFPPPEWIRGVNSCVLPLGTKKKKSCAMSARDEFTAASARRAEGDLAGAARGYAAAIRLAPLMAEAYLNAGWVLSELGRQEEAAYHYSSGLRGREWPADTAAAAHNNLGVVMRELGRADEGRAAFEAALRAKPDFVPAQDNLQEVTERAPVGESRSAEGFAQLINQANELLSRQANDDAAALYRRALTLRDARVDGSAYVGLGAALHGGRRLSEAAHVLAAGAKLNPSSPGMLMNLAIVRADLGQWKASAKAWRRALTLSPGDASSYRAAFGATKRAKGARAALPLLSHAAALDPTNWQNHYSAAHGYLHQAYVPLFASPLVASSGATAAGVEETETTTTTTTTTTGRRRRLEPDATLEVEALRALRPLHRLPISLRMRSRHGAEPPWTRNGGRGLIGDEPSPKALDEIWEMQATSREISKAAGRQSGLIVYKLGPKQSEVDHLRLSLTLLMRYHNRAFRYPILIAHDEELDGHTRDALGALAAGVSLRFARLRVELPSWLAPGSVPESVLGFPVAYRHMIRWKVGLLWQMPEVRDYEYIWSLDTDAFLLGPITYDVFGLMKARNATYGYVDVNVETPEVASGLAD